ncbi:MAG: hypothetical protein KQH67_05640 [Bacteroidetes bacterium]|nr:hypothetical protein [Bacteroidota bacterium]
MTFKLHKKQFLTFLAGALFGSIVITSYAFISKDTPPQDASFQAVSLNDAVALTKEYAINAKPMNKVFYGFAVNIDQLEAMNAIKKNNPNLAGFRLYSGETGSRVYKSIIVGISPDGKDDVSGNMYSAPVLDSGPCPTVCDTHSPLSQSER